MENENKVLAGSEPINPLVMDTPEAKDEGKETAAAQAEPEKATQEEQKDDPIAKLEARLKEKDSMIGRQSKDVGQLRKELDQLRAELAESKKAPAGPSEDQMLADLYQKMDSGEIKIEDGMRQVIQLNSKLTAAQVMQQFQQEQQRNKTAEIQGNFLSKNPDFTEAVESGALQQYLDEDPLADEYAAYWKYKADQRVAEKEKEAQAKIAAAKEEGAKLAKGAEAAGKVLGKQGSSPVPQARPQGPWKNNQERDNAMLEELARFRAAKQT